MTKIRTWELSQKMELCELTQLFKRLPGQSLFTGYFSPLGSNPSGRQKEEVVVCQLGPGHCHDCLDLCVQRESQTPETLCPRRAGLRALTACQAVKAASSTSSSWPPSWVSCLQKEQ